MDEENKRQKNYSVGISIVLAALILGGTWIYTSKNKEIYSSLSQKSSSVESLAEELDLTEESAVLPVKWGDLGQKMVSAGVIDAEKFENVYASRGGLGEDAKALLYASDNGNLKITKENSDKILNLFWALGLGNKNDILDKGEMRNPQYGGAGNFASTGGWTIAKGDAMEHYSSHLFMILTKEQQELVDRVSKGIYRPCCNNATHFPDCNHGMAMLGLLELLASQGASEKEMYRVALIVNSFWFPEQYETIAKYFSQKGISWDKVNAKEVLGANYSSGSGYQKVLSQVEQPVERQRGGSCGV